MILLGISNPEIYFLFQNTFLFFHHPGQFLSTDTKSKIPGIIGHTLFIDVEHDVKAKISHFVKLTFN